MRIITNGGASISGDNLVFKCKCGGAIDLNWGKCVSCGIQNISQSSKNKERDGK